MNRTDGYTTDVSYPAFFHKEMQPVWLSSVVRFLGFAAPDVAKPFTFCELGCGIGINLLVAAASHPQARFVGVDFNERHLRTARDAARSSGLENIEFVHAGFAGFARDNRARFDFVTTHGVWSWIAPEHRASLLECVAAALEPGGLFYLHYMCHPGSTDMLPVQHLLNVFSHHVPGTSAQRAQAGLDLLHQLGEAGLFVDRPAVLARLRKLRETDPNHLAHEFLTDHWRPQHSV
ncbi:class I SAM-dependent methyltransferase [Luteimonas sp. BDR2-5]|uniref:class I SAM-dependent methyltransferase n=1 Tax=Proluteimonas luteida TaxID=2878685 RepID=UPI001E472335|nr:class I SAM-dependent methyltransferase [Luteimonas sp. BDR2-5]MCD9028804.1 class I SAM-dependent methyltransferase [Luteimonas sp. BDR2-5]